MPFYYILEELLEHVSVGQHVGPSTASGDLRYGDFLQIRAQVWTTTGVTEKNQVAREFLTNNKSRRVRFLKG